MSAGLAAMLFGLFVVPGALLWLGHRLRRRTARQRAIFWGALGGHAVAMLVATAAAIFPPEAWGPDNVARGLFGYASLIILPLAGAIAGVLTAGRREALALQRD